MLSCSCYPGVAHWTWSDSGLGPQPGEAVVLAEVGGILSLAVEVMAQSAQVDRDMTHFEGQSHGEKSKLAPYVTCLVSSVHLEEHLVTMEKSIVSPLCHSLGTQPLISFHYIHRGPR